MKCPSLLELPPPPAGKTGWPWTEESLIFPAIREDGWIAPRITIVTPNYNYGQFLEETIRSVLLQGYPDLEYILIDGGSTDASLKVICKYERWITRWVSEKDKGQSSAINKGLSSATGDILAWLNSDDIYALNAFSAVAAAFVASPSADVISGRCRLWRGYPDDAILGPSPLRTYEDFLRVKSGWMNGRLIFQPEAFFRRRAYESAGGVPEEFKLAFDYDFWLRIAHNHGVFHGINADLASLRLHANQKTADIYAGYSDMCRCAWNYFLSSREQFEEGGASVAEEIFSAEESILLHYQRQAQIFASSTSYKMGRLITRFRFWP